MKKSETSKNSNNKKGEGQTSPFLRFQFGKKKESQWRLSVGIPGFEPGMTGPESVVLPLHHIPMSLCFLSKSVAKLRLF